MGFGSSCSGWAGSSYEWYFPGERNAHLPAAWMRQRRQQLISMQAGSHPGGGSKGFPG